MRYADDNILILENKGNSLQLLDIFEEERGKKGLELNSKKTEVLVVNQNNECRQIKGNKLKQRDQ